MQTVKFENEQLKLKISRHIQNSKLEAENVFSL